MLSGVVRVDESNLIPDGNGGYFVHIKSSDIIRDSGYSNYSNFRHGNNYNNDSFYMNSYRQSSNNYYYGYDNRNSSRSNYQQIVKRSRDTMDLEDRLSSQKRHQSDK